MVYWRPADFHLLTDTPEILDVIVRPNLYGDILSDVAAQIAGSVGLAGPSNIGEHGAMFEAIHGSVPRRAGQNLANPSGLILASVQKLIHTYDIFQEGTSRQKVGPNNSGQSYFESWRQFNAVVDGKYCEQK